MIRELQATLGQALFLSLYPEVTHLPTRAARRHLGQDGSKCEKSYKAAWSPRPILSIVSQRETRACHQHQLALCRLSPPAVAAPAPNSAPCMRLAHNTESARLPTWASPASFSPVSGSTSSRKPGYIWKHL